MGLPCYHKITSILETGSVLKTTDFDVQRFVDHQHFIILRRYDYVSQQSFTKRGSQWRVDRKRRRLARVAAPGTNYPTATTLEPLGQSASLLIKVLFLVLHKLRCERPSSSGTIHNRPTVTFCESASQFLLGGCYIPFPGPALKEPNVVYRVFLSRFRSSATSSPSLGAPGQYRIFSSVVVYSIELLSTTGKAPAMADIGLDIVIQILFG
ncbi:hypothetical protein E4U23_000639 [Claviceps purpurea]|nr:hypothetical protein E4U23_000639 [Claviceps purpurea]